MSETNATQAPAAPAAPAAAPTQTTPVAMEGQAPSAVPSGQQVNQATVQATPNAQTNNVQKETQGQETAQAAPQFEGGVLDVYNQSTAAPTEYKFTDAQGLEVKNEVTGIFSDMAKDLNLTQEQAQNLFANGMSENGAITRLNVESLKTYNEQWRREIETDPNLGGANMQTTRANISRCMEFADDELKGYLQSAGLGNFPPLVRLFNKVGAALGSDAKFIGGATPAKASNGPNDQFAYLNDVYKDFN